jgi:hypothetical protein
VFKKQLAETFQKIFKVKKVSFDQPDPIALEQETLWIDVEDVTPLMKDGEAGAEVRGTAQIVAPGDKLPFGFLAKAIEKAPYSLTKDLFFYDYETSTRRYQNLVGRGFSFVYFFSTQYDPEIGSIESVEITLEESN